MKALRGAFGPAPEPPPLAMRLNDDDIVVLLPTVALAFASDLMVAIDAVVVKHGMKARIRNTVRGYVISASAAEPE